MLFFITAVRMAAIASSIVGSLARLAFMASTSRSVARDVSDSNYKDILETHESKLKQMRFSV